MQSFLSVNLFENDLKLYLNKPHKAVYGNQLGGAIGNCTALQTNYLHCEAQHTEKPDWHLSTTIEFYNIGNIQIIHLPYMDNLTVKKYYGNGIQPEKRQVPWKPVYVCKSVNDGSPREYYVKKTVLLDITLYSTFSAPSPKKKKKMIFGHWMIGIKINEPEAHLRTKQ